MCDRHVGSWTISVGLFVLLASRLCLPGPVLGAAGAGAASTPVGSADYEPRRDDPEEPSARQKRAAPGHPSGKEPWNVDDPGFPCDTLDFEVEEGTWISVDVDPSGTRLAFDLLGDIYTLPIEGGEATCVSSGLPYEVQPRWSPDGSRILFTSDRGGGDNLWTMDPDGGNRRALTRETYRLLNNGVWHPSGRFVIGRKHFTSRRSMGAGEMWLYAYPEGGPGVRLTERRNDQQDANDPEYSPDGRYLYWDEDMSPGDHFEYNKDPHGTIYVLRRLDLETGEIRDLIRRPGGAVRPQASPDGKRLAFVHRVRGATVLALYDLATGGIRDLWNGLSRDQQETWCLFGAHPGFDWTPDGRSIVISAQGKLWRVDAETGEPTPIPFRARVRQAYARTVRFPLPAGETEIDVKVIRWPQVTADERKVVFQALGYLYVGELRDGTLHGPPRRITRQQEEYEFAPSLAPDGRSVVYVTWNDQAGGRIRQVDLTGGQRRTLVDAPGHYGSASLSPDGRQLVYQRLGGGWMRGYLWTEEPGIYLLELEARGGTGAAGDPGAAGQGAPPAWSSPKARNGRPLPPGRLLTREGRSPRFRADGRRIYLMTSDKGRSALASIDLLGGDRQVHAVSERAAEIVVSPDDRYLAFEELWQTYVVPFPLRGRPLQIGPDSKDLPVRRLSRDGGTYLSWSHDGRTIRWSLGPELFSASIEAAFAWTGEEDAREDTDPSADSPGGGTGEGSTTEGSDTAGHPADARDAGADTTGTPRPTKEPGVDAQALALGFSVPAAVPDTDLFLTSARILPMNDLSVIENGVVHVRGDRIAEVGTSETIPVPKGARVIDLGGATLLPGFIDIHAHFGTGDDRIYPQQNWALLANLAFGVTTAHDPSHDTEMVYAASEMVRSGQLLGPRIFSTGTILYGAEGDFKTVINSYDDALRAVRRTIAWGPRSVKSYNQPRREQRQMIIRACRELGILDIPEAGSTLHLDMNLILDGHTTIEHPIPVAPLHEPELRLFAASGTGYTPVLIAAYGGLWGENYWYQQMRVWEHERLLRFVPRSHVDPQAIRRTMAPESEYHHFTLAATAADLYHRGGIVEVGAHGQLQGLGYHWELWMLEQGGFSPHEALRCATFLAARSIGLDHALGSIQAGMLADLIVVNGDLLSDLRQSESITYTMVGGRLYDARTLEQIAPDRRPLPPGPMLEPGPPGEGVLDCLPR